MNRLRRGLGLALSIRQQLDDRRSLCRRIHNVCLWCICFVGEAHVLLLLLFVLIALLQLACSSRRFRLPDWLTQWLADCLFVRGFFPNLLLLITGCLSQNAFRFCETYTRGSQRASQTMKCTTANHPLSLLKFRALIGRSYLSYDSSLASDVTAYILTNIYICTYLLLLQALCRNVTAVILIYCCCCCCGILGFGWRQFHLFNSLIVSDCPIAWLQCVAVCLSCFFPTTSCCFFIWLQFF